MGKYVWEIFENVNISPIGKCGYKEEILDEIENIEKVKSLIMRFKGFDDDVRGKIDFKIKRWRYKYDNVFFHDCVFRIYTNGKYRNIDEYLVHLLSLEKELREMIEENKKYEVNEMKRIEMNVSYVEFDGNVIRMNGKLICEGDDEKMYCRFGDVIDFVARKYLIVNDDELVWGDVE